MDVHELNRARGQVYHFLSVMFRDELPAELLAKMRDGAFFDQVLSLQESCSIQDFCSGLNRLTSFLRTRSGDEAWRQLRHDYAELFLNAGKNPAFPYESCYHSREPLVMQEPLAAVRAAYRAAGVRKNEAYQDLDDHIAVELEFMRYCADQAAAGEDNDQFDFLRNHLMGWSVDFCAVLTGAAPSEFYRGLAEMTMSFLFNERMYSFAALSDQEASPAYAHILEKMAAAIATLELDPGYALIAEGVRPDAISVFRYPELPRYEAPLFPQGWETALDRNIHRLQGVTGRSERGRPAVHQGCQCPQQYLLRIPAENASDQGKRTISQGRLGRGDGRDCRAPESDGSGNRRLSPRQRFQQLVP